MSIADFSPSRAVFAAMLPEDPQGISRTSWHPQAALPICSRVQIHRQPPKANHIQFTLASKREDGFTGRFSKVKITSAAKPSASKRAKPRAFFSQAANFAKCEPMASRFPRAGMC